MKIAIAKYLDYSVSNSCHRTSDGYMYNDYSVIYYKVYTIGHVSDEYKVKIREYEENNRSEYFDKTPCRFKSSLSIEFDKKETLSISEQWGCGIINPDDNIDEIRVSGENINVDFNIVKYENLYYLHQFGYRFCINGLYGLIKDGYTILQPIYKSIYWHEHDEYNWKKQDELALIFLSQHGEFKSILNERFCFNYTMITTSMVDAILARNDGLNLCVKSNSYGVLDDKGNTILPFSKDYIELGNHSIYYKLEQNGKRPMTYTGENYSCSVFDNIRILDSALLLFDVWDDNCRHAVYSLAEGKFITQYEYDAVYVSKNPNYIIVEQDLKKGLICNDGTTIVDCLYDDIDERYLNFGYVIVKLNNRKGLFSITNRFYFSCQYDNIVCLNDETIIVNKRGRLLVDRIIYGETSLFNLRCGYVNLLQNYNIEFLSWKEDGVLKIGKRGNKLPRFGIVSYEGEPWLECKYTSISALDKTLRVFRVSDDNNETYYLVQNNRCISQRYNIIYSFNNGLSIVYNGPIKIINKKIRPVVGQGNFGIIRTDGTIVEDLKWKFITACKHNGLYKFERWDHKEFLWKDGKQISSNYDIICMESEGIMHTYNGLYRLKEGKKIPMNYGMWGSVDYNGVEIIPMTNNYEKICSGFKCGMARVKMGGLYGFINNKGELVISCQYHKAGDFINDIARVEIDNYLKEIDKSGRVVSDKGRVAKDYPEMDDYTQKELNDMYMDALGGNPEIWAWNID